jgi:hypothetical protein
MAIVPIFAPMLGLTIETLCVCVKRFELAERAVI